MQAHTRVDLCCKFAGCHECSWILEKIVLGFHPSQAKERVSKKDCFKIHSLNVCVMLIVSYPFQYIFLCQTSFVEIPFSLWENPVHYLLLEFEGMVWLIPTFWPYRLVLWHNLTDITENPQCGSSPPPPPHHVCLAAKQFCLSDKDWSVWGDCFSRVLMDTNQIYEEMSEQ